MSHADDHIQDGLDELTAHQNGECQDPCQYCDIEERSARQLQRRKSSGHKGNQGREGRAVRTQLRFPKEEQ